MKTFISDLVTGGGQLKSYFILAGKESAVASNQKPFMKYTFGDRTGEIKALQWDLDQLAVDLLEVVQVVAYVEEYPKGSGRLQLKVDKIRRAQPAEYDLADFLPAGDRPPAEALSELQALIAAFCSDKVADLLQDAIEAYKPQLLVAPAAKKYHHAFVGGLLEHITALVKGGIAMSKCYPELNLDVLIAGALFHDIGKLVELSPALGFRYTLLGQLQGHVISGSLIVSDFLQEHWLGYDPLGETVDVFATNVMHIIASHHGLLEHGAATLPKTIEAVVFHNLDMIDSRMGAIRAAANLPGEEEGYTAFVPMLKTSIWKGTECQTSQPQKPPSAPAPPPESTTAASAPASPPPPQAAPPPPQEPQEALFPPAAPSGLPPNHPE